VNLESKLQKLLAEGEGQKLEFKEKFQSEAIEAICAFSNAEGGVILIGVTDNGEPLGVQVGRKTLEDWANQINAGLDPRIKVDMAPLPEILDNQRQIVEIVVPQSQSSVVSFNGRFFKRVGKTNQRMTGEDIAQKMMSTVKLSWDSGVEDRATLSDLDDKACSTFVQLLNKHGRRPVPEDSSPELLLTKLGLMENGSLTRAAILLFAKNPQKFYPTATIKLGRFRSKTQIEDDKELLGPIINQLNDGIAWFRDRLAIKLEISGADADRNTQWEYPIPAVREALANAVCHRDYRLERNIQVRLFDDYLQIWNPGALPSNLSVQDLLKEHESFPRNLKLAESLYNAGFIEKWGTGTTRMDELLRGAGHPSPEFGSDNSTFRLCFRKSYSAEHLIQLGLNERQVDLITQVAPDFKITNQFYSSKFEVTKRTASRELSELIEKKLLTKHGSTGRGTYYTRV
jgi:ATP-dependent DNA helicase RecG